MEAERKGGCEHPPYPAPKKCLLCLRHPDRQAIGATPRQGLVTTHDLALAKIADELAPLIENVHFEDHIEDGEIHFDYRLRQGVVTKSNALALMRAVGLDV